MPFIARLSLPLLFVTLYGSGFVGTRLGLPYAEPFMFLALRFLLAAIVLGLIALAIGAPWPVSRREVLHIVGAGVLTIGVFSAGVFYSIARGLPPAVSALIIALHPILVAVGASRLLAERITVRQGTGLVLGLIGVFLVLRGGLGTTPGYWLAAGLSVLGLCGLSGGNLYQKAHCANMNVFTGGAIQCAVCALLAAAGAGLVESGAVQWSGEFVVALIWMSVIVSAGAVSLLYVLIRQGEVSRVAGIFYLVPVAAAIAAYLLFDQRIAVDQWLGIGVVAAGVAMASIAHNCPTRPAARRLCRQDAG